MTVRPYSGSLCAGGLSKAILLALVLQTTLVNCDKAENKPTNSSREEKVVSQLESIIRNLETSLENINPGGHHKTRILEIGDNSLEKNNLASLGFLNPALKVSDPYSKLHKYGPKDMDYALSSNMMFSSIEQDLDHVQDQSFPHVHDKTDVYNYYQYEDVPDEHNSNQHTQAQDNALDSSVELSSPEPLISSSQYNVSPSASTINLISVGRGEIMTQQDTSNQDLLADKDDDAQHEDEDEGGDEDEDDAVERLPKPAPWIDAPTCPAWGPMESFYDQGVLEEQYVGRWYLQEKSKDISDFTEKCWSVVYTVDQRRRSILRTSHYLTVLGGLERDDSGEVYIPDPRDPNLLVYQPQDKGSWVKYRVLATDYKTFTIEYSCTDNNIIKRNEKVLIYTREKMPRSSVLKRAYSTLNKLGLYNHVLRRTSQEDCPDPEVALRRIDAPTTTTKPFLNIGTPAISTGDLTSMMMGSGMRFAQKVLAPWTLHPRLGFRRNQRPRAQLQRNRPNQQRRRVEAAGSRRLMRRNGAVGDLRWAPGQREGLNERRAPGRRVGLAKRRAPGGHRFNGRMGFRKRRFEY